MRFNTEGSSYFDGMFVFFTWHPPCCEGMIPCRLAELSDALGTYPEVHGMLLDARIAVMATAAVQSCMMETVPWYVAAGLVQSDTELANSPLGSAGLRSLRGTCRTLWTKSMLGMTR